MKSRIILAFTLMIFFFCDIVMAQNNAIGEGVIINGVCWATRNVDKTGVFTEKPESFGKLYQWNRNTAWSATDSIVVNWDRTRPIGDEWGKVNDPSPSGWRVPTMDEIGRLFDTGKVSNEWLNQNGVTGRKFTDIQTGNSIFLPAAGYRFNIDGRLYDTGSFGHYWSNEQSDGSYAYGLYFSSAGADYFYYDLYRSDGRFIRPVAE